MKEPKDDSDSINRYKEIAVQRDASIEEHYDKLTPQERVFIYYLFRAGIPGNKITTDQIHRSGNEIIELFESVVKNASMFKEAKFNFDANNFLEEAKIFLVYLYANHGQYFYKEHSNEKRTPQILQLSSITPENLTAALEAIKFKEAKETVDRLKKVIFDASYEPTKTVPGSIEKSACNIYSEDFSEEDYRNVPMEDRNAVNSYFYVDHANGKRVPKVMRYCSSGRCANEINISIHWLNKAFEHAKKYPKQFDQHLINSLAYMIKFLQTGDEDFFRKHSIEWLQSNSRIDYCFGFIEVYDDPKSVSGSFQAEVTIKAIDINKLNLLIPLFEDALPFPSEFKRDIKTATIPNASINKKIFASGHLGPLQITAAYCLPNYDDIRADYGSKQIIYPADKSLGEFLNPSLSRKLFHLKDEADWLSKHDPDNKLGQDLWNLQCILHETIGHGSGRLATHKFRDNDQLTIAGATYKTGDSIAVTSSNIKEFLAGYDNTLEELRAEIISLYISVVHLDELAKNGFLAQWLLKLGKKELQVQLMLNMINSGLRRLFQQSDSATEVAGDHARANQTIMNYMLDDRGVELVEEKLQVDDKEYSVLGCKIVDFEKAMQGIEDLMLLVQTIKSTGDGVAIHELIEKYGVKMNRNHFAIMKKNLKAVAGDLKVACSIYPGFTPVKDIDDNMVDVKLYWPTDLIEQRAEYAKLLNVML